MTWKLFLAISLICASCQTQPEVPSPVQSNSEDRPLEREDVIPLDGQDQITSETNHFSVSKDQSEENLFEKIRFRKTNVTKSIQEINVPLETVVIYPVDKKTDSDVIKRANLQMNNLLQKWFDLNYQKLSEYAPTKSQETLNEIQINFPSKSIVQIEISSSIEGMKALSEEISLND